MKQRSMQQISESELVLMKIIWKSGGSILFSRIIEELDQSQNGWKKNTVLTLLPLFCNPQYTH